MSVRFTIRSLSEKYRKLFRADGCSGLPKPIRSPWHDYEEKRRKGNRRDFLSNVWGVCVGSSDAVFDHIIMEKIKLLHIRPPDYTGEIAFETDNEIITNVVFKPNSGRQNFSWWSPLDNFRPNQLHNYILACDISYGLGSSNSVIEIYDCNTKEQVGELVDPFVPPAKFADIAVATARWLGGQNQAFLLWENNGGQASTFRDRVKFQGYYNVYMKRKEEAKYRKKSDTYGWRSNADAKAILLSNLGTALTCSLTGADGFVSLKIHSKELLEELLDYIWYENGDAGTSKTADLKSGAKKRHGDRVIGMGMCILGTKDQLPATIKQPVVVPANSFMARFNRWIDEEAEKARFERVLS